MFNQFLISEDKTIFDALIAINSIGNNDPLTLFVIESDNQIIGTLTDGDIRRSLIDRKSINTKVRDVAHAPFTYLVEDSIDVRSIHEAKDKGIELIPILNDKKQVVEVVNLKKKKSCLPIDAVLMAGGKGERLRPLTEKTPKPLLPVGGKAIIDYNIDRLVSYGVKHINVTVNYLKEQLEEHFREHRGDVYVRTVREPKFLGTIGSIRFVDNFYNDSILVMNSDVFTNLNFEDFYLHFKEHDAEMSVCAIPYSVQVPYGIFTIEGRRDIKGLVEKPTYNYYANAGIYLIKKSALGYIPEDKMFHSTDLIEALISAGKKVIRFPLNGTWIDIGNPQEYNRANELVKHLI